ncbi:hypothetical protein ANANG_G00174410 [Anguilla anguilla]|uniref:Uncharacterized protein n=1 Tax=Anguilla anguilla TaxID=7936 RepID=A0A9D3M410_ANGAN|nr:hypothetical protein ANANG_G00174410 [Anguilla anguilla]
MFQRRHRQGRSSNWQRLGDNEKAQPWTIVLQLEHPSGKAEVSGAGPTHCRSCRCLARIGSVTQEALTPV